MAEARLSLKSFSPGSTVFLFLAAAALLALATGPLHRLLVGATGVEPVVAWFLLGGGAVFLPLLLVSWLILKSEGYPLRCAWRDRLRFRRLDAGDMAWTAAGLFSIAALTGLTILVATLVGRPLDLHPTFMRLEPLGLERLWILALWAPFFLLNIFGEEVLWRGVILPRQEVAMGEWAWLANGLGWLIFHFAFGSALMLTLVPITLILPYIVQRRRNSWVGVILHAGLNGPGFLAVAFDLP